jgi:hypothetical protein
MCKMSMVITKKYDCRVFSKKRLGGGRGLAKREYYADVNVLSSIDFIYFWGSNKKQRSCDGRVGRAAPV